MAHLSRMHFFPAAAALLNLLASSVVFPEYMGPRSSSRLPLLPPPAELRDGPLGDSRPDVLPAAAAPELLDPKDVSIAAPSTARKERKNALRKRVAVAEPSCVTPLFASPSLAKDKVLRRQRTGAVRHVEGCVGRIGMGLVGAVLDYGTGTCLTGLF